jgi:hypothetical protein
VFIAYVALAALLSVMLVGSATAKLKKGPAIVTTLASLDVPLSWFGWLGSIEVAGALGLLAGIVVGSLGVAAAVGVVLYFVGAGVAHLRAKDLKPLATPVVILLAAGVTAALRLASM